MQGTVIQNVVCNSNSRGQHEYLLRLFRPTVLIWSLPLMPKSADIAVGWLCFVSKVSEEVNRKCSARNETVQLSSFNPQTNPKPHSTQRVPDWLWFRWFTWAGASELGGGAHNFTKNNFYRATHCSAKRGIRIVCRLFVCLSVRDVGGLWSHTLKFLDSNCMNNELDSFALRTPHAIHLHVRPRDMEKFPGD